MNIYASEYYQRVKENFYSRHSDAYESLLELLWSFYASEHQNDTSVFEYLNQAESIFHSLSKKRQNKLVRIVVDICIIQEHAAFMEGAILGAQMTRDLLGQTTPKQFSTEGSP